MARPPERWPQLLQDLAEVCERYFRRDSTLSEQEARMEAQSLVEHLADEFGGEPFYLPRGDAIRRYRRDQAILAEYDGDNIRRLAKRYGLSERYVRRVITREQRGE